ncbi:glycosyltransferase [Streptomyces sp. NPDC089919]|uniref:glycosyltransferase n=1 Tax=Streptomyces sp. NPDC089919 TaxID=3155188 RepID=UPI00342E06C9
MKIVFLIHNRYAIGGVIKSTVNLAAALDERHQVEVVSLLRDRQYPAFPLPDAVTSVDLVDLRPTSPTSDAENPLLHAPVQVFPTNDGMRAKDNSRLVEVRLARYLAATDADMVISCHPGIAVCLGRMEGSFLKVAQIHQNSASLGAGQRAALLDAAAGLDAVVSVSSEDAANLGRLFEGSGAHVTSIPNCVPPLPGPPSDGRGRTVVAAGRLDKGKRYDVLIRAFAPLAALHPRWRLRIYGRGPERAALNALVGELDLHDRVLLMGASDHMDSEWAKADIAVSASASECLPMNIIEAMSAGLPVVSTDCDFGPREIITHGEDGFLVPVDDPDALTAALRALVEDPVSRRHMGAAARLNAFTYSPHAAAEEYEALGATLAGRRALPGTADWDVGENGDVAVHVTSETTESLWLVGRNASDGSEAHFALVPGVRRSSPQWRTALLKHQASVLPEGRWDLYTASGEQPSSVRRRLTGGRYDNRHLVRIDGPEGTREAFHALVPVVDAAGRLAVRSWVRPVHAEADRIVRYGEDGFTVLGRLWGDELSPRGEVLLRGRRHRELDCTLPVEAIPGGGFHFTVPVQQLARRRMTEHDVWDLHLVTAPDAAPVRIGRFLGDYPDKKTVHDYAPVVLKRSRRGPVRIRPFFTVDSELSMNAVTLA